MYSKLMWQQNYSLEDEKNDSEIAYNNKTSHYFGNLLISSVRIFH